MIVTNVENGFTVCTYSHDVSASRELHLNCPALLVFRRYRRIMCPVANRIITAPNNKKRSIAFSLPLSSESSS